LIPFETEGPNDDDNHDQSIPVERVFRRDIFHNTKVGILRDFVGIFVGSVIMLLCKLNYFNEAGQPNGREQVLHRAYCHFHLFGHTAGRSPGLRSFSAAFFNAPSWDCFEFKGKRHFPPFGLDCCLDYRPVD